MTEQAQLSIRINETNPNHHLWNNNGVWFIHYTMYPTPVTTKRVRCSLRTSSVLEARVKRDDFFSRTQGER